MGDENGVRIGVFEGVLIDSAALEGLGDPHGSAALYNGGSPTLSVRNSDPLSAIGVTGTMLDVNECVDLFVGASKLSAETSVWFFNVGSVLKWLRSIVE